MEYTKKEVAEERGKCNVCNLKNQRLYYVKKKDSDMEKVLKLCVGCCKDLVEDNKGNG